MAFESPLISLLVYSQFIASVPDQFPGVRRSTLTLYSISPRHLHDPQPHSDDPSLASTFPHHKHVPPNIKRNRIPAPGISFTRPNLPFVIREIEQIVLGEKT